MQKFMMLIGAAAMAVSMPALAQGQGKGNSGKAQVSAKAKGNKGAQMRTRTDVRADKQAARTARQTARGTRLDSDGDGILDRFERDSDLDGIPDYREGRVQRSADRNGNGILDRFESGSRVNFCPPGLAKKSPACVPPGQAKRDFNQGQRLPGTYRDFISYEDLLRRVPQTYQGQIPTGQRYIYRDNTVYVVDPTTRVVRSIIDLLL